jgi:hypothetical protein
MLWNWQKPSRTKFACNQLETPNQREGVERE